MTKMRLMTATALALSLAACGGGNDAETRERQMEAELEKRGFEGDVEIGEDGEVETLSINAGAGTVGRNLSLPAGFPEDIPYPADWNIMAAAEAAPGMFTVQAIVEEDIDTIVNTLRDSMESAGWSEDAFDQPVPSMTRIGFAKDNRTASINITKNGATNVVQLVTLPRQ